MNECLRTTFSNEVACFCFICHCVSVTSTKTPHLLIDEEFITTNFVFFFEVLREIQERSEFSNVIAYLFT